ncbi:MAG: cytochrome c oxidase accessory protein CcoG [Sandaracinus sp.]
MSSPESDPTAVPVEKVKVRLAVYDRASSLRKDGQRPFVHTADVSGRFMTLKRVVFYVLIGIWAVLPWLELNGRPAVFLDVPARRFFLFGGSFDATSFWLLWFLLTGILFSLLLTTTTLGRVWCGYACPQTVFLEGMFRRIERLFEGPRNERIARDSAPLSLDKFLRRTGKHIAYVLAALFISHMFVAYFVSMPSLLEMMTRSPSEHPYAFAWCFAVGTILYGNFAWFREQVCLIVCPYGRLQSVLLDDDSIVIGYDDKRGEPRGKGKPKEGEARGDCVDCNRCVVVCPTGIDIRHGLQIDCVGCAQCIDACDDVMDKLKKPRGLIRYDSLHGLRGEKKRFWRPRVFFYLIVGTILVSTGAFFLTTRSDVEARILRLRGLPYVVEGDSLRNAYEIHLVNDSDIPRTFELETSLEGLEGTIFAGEHDDSTETLEIPPWTDRRVTVVVRTPREGFHAGGHLHATVRVGRERRDLLADVLGPSSH